jgi:molybdopterin-guanine dinucleotide biosynthesis protein A
LDRPIPTLVILAGGAGSRMGTPKSLLRIAGKPILHRLLDRLNWPGPTTLITAPGLEHPPGHERFTAELTDSIAGEGPLRGILTALEATQGPIVVIPLDMPNLARDQLVWLVAQFEKLEHCIALATRPAASGDVEPLPCALRPDAARPIRGLLAAGRRSVKGLFDLPGAFVLPAPADWPASVWLNLNHPEDLREFGA